MPYGPQLTAISLGESVVVPLGGIWESPGDESPTTKLQTYLGDESPTTKRQTYLGDKSPTTNVN